MVPRASIATAMRTPRVSEHETFMKYLSILVAAVVLSTAAPVRAEQLDLSTIKCKEFVNSGKETIGLILMWMEGFYTDQDAKPIVDFDKMQSDGQKLGEYCGKNPEHSLISAAKDVMDK
jgi:acid stress chaperone HdeB